ADVPARRPEPPEGREIADEAVQDAARAPARAEEFVDAGAEIKQRRLDPRPRPRDPGTGERNQAEEKPAVQPVVGERRPRREQVQEDRSSQAEAEASRPRSEEDAEGRQQADAG